MADKPSNEPTQPELPISGGAADAKGAKASGNGQAEGPAPEGNGAAHIQAEDVAVPVRPFRAEQDRVGAP